jgi:hypothetical protein
VLRSHASRATSSINMTSAASLPEPQAEASSRTLSSWRELRDDPDIQFEQIATVSPTPREPSWLEELLQGVFELLGSILGLLDQLLGANWGVLQWVLLAGVLAFVIYCVFRFAGPLALRRGDEGDSATIEDWTPTSEESAKLLEDADRLAQQGRFDEAVRVLLQRSIGQIAAARPGLVEPSSTARELSVLPALSQDARRAFAAISQRVERSLFALRSLSEEDWKAARAAYSAFATARFDRADDAPQEATV